MRMPLSSGVWSTATIEIAMRVGNFTYCRPQTRKRNNAFSARQLSSVVLMLSSPVLTMSSIVMSHGVSRCLTVSHNVSQCLIMSHCVS